MEKKHVTNTARILLELWNTGTFAAVWMAYYNRFTFDTYRVSGGFLTVFLFFIVYNMFCSLYKAFRIASSSVGEAIFSQALSFGIADLVFYVECCLVWNRYVSFLPGALAAMVQILGTVLLVWRTKRYFMEHVAPKKTLLIRGEGVSDEDAEGFCSRILQKYAHLFDIKGEIGEQASWEELSAAIDSHGTVLMYGLSAERRAKLAAYCMTARKQFYFTPQVFDIMLQGCSPRHLLDTPLLKYDYISEKMEGDMLKRTMDILFSLFMLLLLSPVLLITAAAVRMEDKGPILFRQKRCTKDARVFEILKFRSMVVDAEKHGVTPCAANDSRVTRVGKIIRATRIDELPQLFNILKGDMSLVGPRPERVEHVKQYMEEVPGFGYRMQVKGGLTGYAQIFGKYNTSAHDKLLLDLMYIENQSLLLDLKIIMLTLRTIFQPESTEGFSPEKSRKINYKAKQDKVLQMDTDLKKDKILEQIAK